MEVYPCPLCGRTQNRHGEPFDSVQKVVGHIDGARDAKHEGESGRVHADDIEGNQVEMSQDEIQKEARKHSSRAVSADPLETTFTSRRFFDGEEMALRDFLALVDDYMDSPEQFGGASDQEVRELQQQLDDLEEQIEKQEDVMNRILGYIQMLAQDQGRDEVLEDMLDEGYL